MHWKIISTVLVIIVSLVIGSGVGMYYQEKKNDDTKQNTTALSDDKVIAIVNLDEGIEIEGENQSYSNVIVSSLEGEYKIVPYQMAKDGLSSGAYSAVVCFPVDFSKKVYSVNSKNPEKIMFDFDINKDLPEKMYIETYTKIEELQNSINSTISYMYLYSIYSEMHDAQDKAAKLLLNDKKDLKEIEKIKAYDFAERIDMSDIPNTKVETSNTDFEKYKKTVKDYAGDMSDIYLDSYKKASKTYNEIDGKLVTKISDMKIEGNTIINSIDDWSTVHSNQWYSDSDSWFTDIFLWYSAVTSWDTNADSWLNSANTWQETANNQVDTINNDIQRINRIIDEYNTLKPSTEPRVQPLPNFTQVPPATPGAIAPLTVTAPPNPAVLNISLTNFSQLLDDIESLSNSYDPLDYLTQEEQKNVAAIVSDYSTEIEKVKTELTENESTNMAQVVKVLEDYNTHIYKLREMVDKAYSKEKDDVSKAVSTFINTKTLTSKENKELIENFSEKMPNSRLDSSVNTTLAEYITSPIELNHADIRDEAMIDTETDNFSINKYAYIVICVLLLLLVFSIAMGIRSKRQMRLFDNYEDTI